MHMVKHSTSRWFRHLAWFILPETPARLQTTALDVQFVTSNKQHGVNWLAATTPTCSPIRQCHESESYVSLTNFGHQIRTQQLQHTLGLSGHSHPRIAGVDIFGFNTAASNVILKSPLLNNIAETPHCFSTAHRNLHQSVRRIHDVVPLSWRHITNRNASFAIEQPGCPRN